MPIQQGKRLSNLSPLESLTGNELVYLVDPSGNSKRTLLQNIIDLINSEISGALLSSNNLSDLDDVAVARTNLGLGTLATQNANNVLITGGTINGTIVGDVNSTSGTFTNLTVTSTVDLPANSITVTELQDSEITVNTIDGITGGGTIELGGSITISVDEIDGGIF